MAAGRQILLYAGNGREWAALLVDSRLEDLMTEDADQYPGPRIGEVCLGQVRRLGAGGRAAFLDIGDDRTGYLRDAEGLQPGDLLPLQVDRFAFEDKAARMSETISLPGRYAVLVSSGEGVGVSRRIADPEERNRISGLLEPLAGEYRIVVRTAAVAADDESLVGEVEALHRDMEDLFEAAETGEPRSLAAGNGPVRRALDDWAAGPEDQVIGAGELLEGVLLDAGPDSLEWLGGEGELLDVQDLDGQIRAALAPRVELAGGGWIALEQTTALVSIDVNAGSGDLGRQSVSALGCEAAREIPRQLRLRGLAGIVVVDFPNGSDEDDSRIEAAMEAGLRADSVGGRIHGWTEGGLFEFTRRRDRRPLGECFGEAD